MKNSYIFKSLGVTFILFVTLFQGLAVASDYGFKFLGCYKNKGDAYGYSQSDLSHYANLHSPMNVQKCVTYCGEMGFPYAGLQDGKFCACGKSYGRYGKANNCNIKCSGDIHQNCGGLWSSSIYLVLKKHNKPKVIKNNSQIKYFDGFKYSYEGCYRDQGNPYTYKDRDLHAFGYNSDDSLTVESCVRECGRRGYKYAAMQYSHGCVCDNSYGKYGKADNCNMKCTGNSSEICGGEWANSVYKIHNPRRPAMVPKEVEVGIDRLGGDYKSFNLPYPDYRLCQKACDKDRKCKAWTYVIPFTIQGPIPKCWLKSQIPNALKNDACISGVKKGISIKDNRDIKDNNSYREGNLFVKPKINGYRLDWCREWARDCGKGAADAFCKLYGYPEASSWEMDPDIGLRIPTKIITSGKICNEGFCDGFKFIKCKEKRKDDNTLINGGDIGKNNDNNSKKDKQDKFEAIEIINSPQPPYEAPVAITFKSKPYTKGYWYVNGAYESSGNSFRKYFDKPSQYIVEFKKERGSLALAKKVVDIQKRAIDRVKIITSPTSPYRVPVTISFTTKPLVDGYWYINGNYINDGDRLQYTFNRRGSYTIEFRQFRDKGVIGRKELYIKPKIKKRTRDNYDSFDNKKDKYITLWGEQTEGKSPLEPSEIHGNEIHLNRPAKIIDWDLKESITGIVSVDYHKAKNRTFWIYKKGEYRYPREPILYGGGDYPDIRGRVLATGTYRVIPHAGYRVKIKLQKIKYQSSKNNKKKDTMKNEEIVLWGEQKKGTGPLSNAEVDGNSVTLTEPMQIVKMEKYGDGKSYCIFEKSKPYSAIKCGDNEHSLRGYILQPGEYTLTVQPGSWKTTVRLYLKPLN